MSIINRRNFFAGIGTGILGLSIGKHASASPAGIPSVEGGAAISAEPRIKKYVTLGNTGLKVSDLIFGSTSFFSPNVAEYAYDLGVTCFDTAENYMGGKAEEYFGKALKGKRDKVVIITKHFGRRSPGQKLTGKMLIEKVDASLKSLKTDYLDVVFFHRLETFDEIKDTDLLPTYEQLKKEGKIRFTGFSTHHAPVTLKECFDPKYKDFVQVVMFMYNHMEGKKIEPNIKKLHEKGIGTIAMKTMAGGKQGNLKSFVDDKVSYPQVAISWVLGNPDVDCAVLSMRSFSHAEEYIGASGRRMKRDDIAMLKRYRRDVNNEYCRVSCNECESSCPRGVAISDIMRYEMYFADYGHEKEAMDEYALLDKKRKPISCAGCSGYCTTACPFGLKVKDRLINTHEMLSA